MPSPTQPLLDNFNRLDGGLGSNWTGGFGGGTGTLSVVSNQVALTASTGTGGDYRWNAGNTSSADCDSYFDTPVLPDSTSNIVMAVARVNTFSPSWNGYGLYLIPTSIGGDTCNLILAKFLAGSGSTIASALGVQTSTIQGLWINCTGTTITGYVKVFGAWQIPGGGTTVATDTDISTAGAIGMFTDNFTARIDNFGGGPFGAVVVPSLVSFMPQAPMIVLPHLGMLASGTMPGSRVP